MTYFMLHRGVVGEGRRSTKICNIFIHLVPNRRGVLNNVIFGTKNTHNTLISLNVLAWGVMSLETQRTKFFFFAKCANTLISLNVLAWGVMSLETQRTKFFFFAKCANTLPTQNGLVWEGVYFQEFQGF